MQENSINAWFISEIVFPKDSSKISFTYLNDIYQTYSDMTYFQANPYDGDGLSGGVRVTRKFCLPKIITPQLFRIKWPNGKLDFRYQKRRDNYNFDDIGSNYPNSRGIMTINPTHQHVNTLENGGLTEILIFDSKNIQEKKFELDHIYDSNIDFLSDRLMLISVKEISKDSISKAKWQFNHHSFNQSFLSNNQGFWGYFRKDPYHTIMYPTEAFQILRGFESISRIPKISRSAQSTSNPNLDPAGKSSRNELMVYTNPNLINTNNVFRANDIQKEDCQAGLLYNIVYPSGNWVKLEYEPHSFNASPDVYNGGLIDGGGVRVKKIESFIVANYKGILQLIV